MTALNSFKGGMWNDEYLLAEGQYVYAENLDPYRDPRWIQLAVKPTNYQTAITDMVYLMADSGTSITTNSTNIYYALGNKDIIDSAWNLRFDGSTIRPNALWQLYSHWRAFSFISDAISFWDFYGGILIPKAVQWPAASPTWQRDSGWVYDWEPYAFSFIWDAIGATYCSTGWTRPFYTKGLRTLFGDEADQYYIDKTSSTGGMAWHWAWAFWPWYPTVTSVPQSINQPWEVVFASVHSDSIWSWSTNRGRTYTELCAFAPSFASGTVGVQQVTVDIYSKILHWVNKNSTDILVAWDVSEYIYNTDQTSPSNATYASISIYKHYGFGADAQQLIAKSRYSNNLEVAFGNHWTTFYLVGIFWFTNYNWARINDMVYCVSNKDDVWVIYAYGKTFAGAQDAWSVLISKNSAGKTMKRIGCLYRNYAKNWFYYTYEDEDGVFGVDYYDDITIDTPTSYQPSGKVFLRTDDAGDMSVNKEVLNLKVWCKVPENTTIIISYILDNSGTEIVYDTISHTTQGSTDYKIYRGNKPVKGFKCISWFVEMTTTGTTTPQLLNFNYDLWIIQN